MAARRGSALEQWGAQQLDALSQDGGAEASATAAPDHEGRAAVAARERAVFVLFDRGTPDDARCGRALAAVAAGHADRVRAVRVAEPEVRARLDAWRASRRAYDTYDFDRWPAVGVFRGGHLVTTFHPRRVFFPEPLQEREEREQLEIFLAKMVYFDPAQVKEQKSLQLEAGG